MTDILAVSPTRSELLNIKRKAALAKKGHSLLKKKQDVLINEFFKRVQHYKQAKQDIVQKKHGAYDALQLDIAYSGIFVSRSISYAMPEQFQIESQMENIMGVRLPIIKAKKKDAPMNTYENAPQLAEATRQFHDLFANLINLASMEMAIYALADEIKKIKRRVNSLEFIQIPKLERTTDYIRFVLGEQERENFTRLKMIKQKLQA